jgi:hypothetical protein
MSRASPWRGEQRRKRRRAGERAGGRARLGMLSAVSFAPLRKPPLQVRESGVDVMRREGGEYWHRGSEGGREGETGAGGAGVIPVWTYLKTRQTGNPIIVNPPSLPPSLPQALGASTTSRMIRSRSSFVSFGTWQFLTSR